MEVTAIITVWVDLEEIIDVYHLSKDSTKEEIADSVKHRLGQDDEYCLYYITHDEFQRIVDELTHRLKDEPTSEDWEDFWRSEG